MEDDKLVQDADLFNVAKVQMLKILKSSSTTETITPALNLLDKLISIEGKWYKQDSDFSKQEAERLAIEAKVEFDKTRLTIDQGKLDNDTKRIGIEERKLISEIERDTREREANAVKQLKEEQKEVEKEAEDKKEKMRAFGLKCLETILGAAGTGMVVGLLRSAIGFSAWQDANNVIPNVTSKEAVKNATSFSLNVLKSMKK